MKQKLTKTNAMRILDSKKIIYQTHCFETDAAVSGVEAAATLNQNPNQVFKTLVTVGNTKENYVFLVPVNKELDLKKGAIAVGAKSIEMIKSKDLLSLTGYVHGACSPIGMKKVFKTVIDSSANDYETILFSAGKFGQEIEISLSELAKVISFDLSDITNI